ncbi:MAG: RNA-binding S4 domain-containing protein [Selenomonas sp.]|nr:RNA-binding S4 domain-containing protein [uncultured Selenomonas sp.]MBF1687897.1 RNA-binding S4 domain-containing protein [Selenomonas sp.]MBF1692160.1 RNA-binding S4 domain-containing protein [Selenomonas sp.]MBF1695277.1 RNA-binding S4 domain-containing protein [Selenomonas sp.]MBF1714848.1 RNA-binding S4 domain-containing protein [Selenomonas sp.]
MMDIAIHTDTIQLDQFLKLAGAVASGGEVKALLAEGMILRNDVPETARRRKLVPGDVITIDGNDTYRVVRV